MIPVTDFATLGPTDRATVEEAELFLSSMLTIREEANNSPPSRGPPPTSCTRSAIAKTTEIVGPRILRGNVHLPPAHCNPISSRSKVAPDFSTRTFGITPSRKIQRKENVCGIAAKARVALEKYKSRRVYASPYRARRSDINMSESERLEVLEGDEFIGEIEPTSIWCLSCEAWVALDKRRKYYVGMWEKHKKCYHLPGGRQYELAQKIYEETGQRVKLFEPKRQKEN